MAIMRVNVRPAPKFRWNRRAQRRAESNKPVLTTEYNNIEQADIPHADIQHAYIQSETSPSAPDANRFFGTVDTPSLDQESSAESAIRVTPIEKEKNSTDAPAKSRFDLKAIDSATIDSIQKGKLGYDSNWQKIVWQLTPETPVGRALVSATQRLESSDIDTAALDAQVILAHILGKDRAWLFAHHDYLLSEDEARQFTDCVVRRMDYEPVAYLIGSKEFYGLDFTVDRRVLIPRPETELLVDAVLSHLEMWADEMPLGHQLCVADVGTGCGAIAVSVATNAPDVRVFATDISPDALEIARTNIRRLDERCQVSLLQGDLLSPLQNKVDMPKVDIIAANLPYINSSDYAVLQPDVRNFEPQLALEAGPQGLDTIAQLLEQAPRYLNPNGVIILEIGYDQGDAVLALVEQLIPEARIVDLRQDYNGQDRLVTVAL